MGRVRNILMLEHVNAVKALFNDTKYNFVAIGYHLRKVDDDRLYKETGHDDIWEFAAAQFGLSKSSTSRFIGINKRFSKGGYSETLAEAYKEFSVSQLQEMIPLTDEQISMIDSTSTVREIRDMKPKKQVKPEKEDGDKSSPIEYKREGLTATLSPAAGVEEIEPVATSQQTELPDSDECSDCDLYHNKEAGVLECNPECGEYACLLPEPDEIEGITSDDPEVVEILQQENDTTEDPEHYTIFDVKMHLAQEEENLRICREEDIRSKIRQHSAINVAAYKTLLSVMDEADEVLKLSHFANAFYIEGDYGSADFYLYNARMVLNESQNFEKVNRPKVDEFVKLQDLPTMKNNDQRGAFIDDYQSWPLWIETPETGERIFRFNISEDIAIAVRDQKQHLWIPGKYKYSTETEYTGERYYLLGISSNYGVKGAEFKKSQEKTFSESLINRSNLIEFLKKYQKGEVK